MMDYKGYIAKLDFDNDANTFHGEVINTRDVITFQGSSVNQLKKAFEDSIDDYLEFCEERGEEPDRPFSGKFNIRLDPELHRQAYLAAKLAGLSLNTWVANAIVRQVRYAKRS